MGNELDAGSDVGNVTGQTRAADAAAMTEVWRQTWPKAAPVRTTVISDFVVPGALIEISAVAVLRDAPLGK